MGNKQCLDCKEDVPKSVSILDIGSRNWGRRFYKWWEGYQWIKVGDGYLCQDCLRKREIAEKGREIALQREKQRQEQEKQSQLRKKREEEARREGETKRKQEQETKIRQEECARREKEARRKQEQEAEKHRQEEYAKGKREAERQEAERRRQEEHVRREREAKKKQEAERHELSKIQKAKRTQEFVAHELQSREHIFDKRIYQRKFSFITGVEHRYHSIKSTFALDNAFLKSKMSHGTNCHSTDCDALQIGQPYTIPLTHNIGTIAKRSQMTKNNDNVEKPASRENDDILEELQETGFIDDTLKETIKCVLSKYDRIKLKPFYFPIGYKSELKMILNGQNAVNFISNSDLAVCICELCMAVKREKTYWPRNTQVISLVILIKSFLQGKLLEIKTGEGKTCVIAMFSAFLALSGNFVDVVSSSPILAVRDSKEWKSFYQLLSINVDCNLLQNDNNERMECYRKHIVYGTVGSFASDILREEFLMEKVRGDRKMQIVIVDEVDCMLLDQGINSTYLSNTIPGLHILEPVILMIWQQVITHTVFQSEEGDEFFCGNIQPFYLPFCRISSSESLSDPLHILEILESNNLLCPRFTERLHKESLEKLKMFKVGHRSTNSKDSVLKNVNEDCILACLGFMENVFDIQFEPYKIMDENRISICNFLSKNKDCKKIQLLVTNEGHVCPIYDSRNKVYKAIQENIQEKLSCTDSENTYKIPTHLYKFVQDRLITWIENAFIAKYMCEGREYLVRGSEIVPVDYESTGVVELNTKWGDCLHQFLEIKHERKISQLTIETNFMSNQTFFKRYHNHVFGVTGTLGTDLEIDFLRRMYGLTCVKIPTHRKSNFTEIEPLLCSTKEEWLLNIEKSVSDIVVKKRAALLICEDIKTSELLHKKLTKSDCKATVSLYIRNDNDDKIPEKLHAAHVIISTNIAGRGTDIEIDSNVENAGGLFVVVTFLPSNKRVEKQIFGRSARKGLPGSAQLILNLEKLPVHFPLARQDIKDHRDSAEKRRLQKLEKEDLIVCLDKEELFQCYCSILNHSLEILNDDKNMQIICRNSLHEWWGLWLKMHFEKMSNELKKVLEREFRDICQKLLKNKQSPTENVAHVIKLANEYLTKGEYVNAKKLFSDAISMNERSSAFAYYQRAYCLIKEGKGTYVDEAISDLEHAHENLSDEKHCLMLSIALFNMCREHRPNGENCETLNQFGIRGQLLNFVEENISTALKMLQKLKISKKQAEVKGESILAVALGEREICKKVDTEAYMFWELGLTEIITISEKSEFCWKGLVVTLIGVTEIAAGIFLLASTVGILTNVGTCLIAEGVNDICTGSHAMLTKNNNFVKSWMVGKAVSIGISLATFGFSHIKTAVSGASGCKNAFMAVKNQVKDGAIQIVEGFRNIPKAVASETFSSTLKATCTRVAKDVGVQLLQRGGKFLVEESKPRLKKYFDEIATEKISKEVSIVVFKGNLKIILDDFIFYYYEESSENSTKSESLLEKRYKEIMESMLLSDDVSKIRQILVGCASVIMKKAEEKLRLSDDTSVTESLIDIFSSVSSSTYDVKSVVLRYGEKLERIINYVFEDKLPSYRKAMQEKSEDYKCRCERYIDRKKKKIVNLTTSYILRLLQKTLNFSRSLKIAGQLQSVVGGVVTHYVREQEVGKNMIQTILSLSAKTFSDAELLNQIQNIGEEICPERAGKYLRLGLQTMKVAVAIGNGQNIEQKFAYGLQIAEHAANTFSDGKMKDRVLSILKISKTCWNVAQHNEIPSAILKDGLDILHDELESCSPDHGDKCFTFGVKVAKVALLLGNNNDVEQTLGHGLQLVEDALDTCKDVKTKGRTISLIDIAKIGIRMLHSDGKPSELLKESLDVLQNGLRPDNAKNILTLGVKTMKVAISDENKENFAETLKKGLHLVEDALDNFEDGKMKQLMTTLLSIAKKGVRTLQPDGKPEEILTESLDILQGGHGCVYPENAGKFLTFGVKAMKVALSDGNDETLKNGLYLAGEAIKAFTDRETKQLTTLLIRIVKVDVRVLQSNGKYSELLNEILDILQGGPGYMCPVIAEKFFSFGVKSMAIALVDDNDMNIEERLKNGVELAEQALNFFTDNAAKYLTKFVIEVGIRALHRDGKHSDVLKESLDVLQLGLEGYCDGTYYLVSENTRGFTNFKGNGDLKELLKHPVTLEIYSDKTKKDFEDLTKHCRKCRPNDRRNHIILIVKST